MNFSVEKYRAAACSKPNLVAAALVASLVGCAYVSVVPLHAATQDHVAAPSQSGNPNQDHSAPPAAKAAPAQSDRPVILLKDGVLQVAAHNSDLRQILTQVAAAGGMQIDGPVPNAKVYGTYGPANSRAVLTDLLTGLGYNFVMVGSTAAGLPGKLLLTARSNEPSATASNVSPPPASAPASTEEQPGPGAIVNVPPAGPDDPQESARRNLQRLQQMHDQQMKPSGPQ
jgi:hypothetical protein